MDPSKSPTVPDCEWSVSSGTLARASHFMLFWDATMKYSDPITAASCLLELCRPLHILQCFEAQGGKKYSLVNHIVKCMDTYLSILVPHSQGFGLQCLLPGSKQILHLEDMSSHIDIRCLVFLENPVGNSCPESIPTGSRMTHQTNSVN